jgi:hypothetical protein
MSDFEILSEDRSVQRSVFANGVEVTVNFGAKPWTMEDGSVLPPGGFILRRQASLGRSFPTGPHKAGRNFLASS